MINIDSLTNQCGGESGSADEATSDLELLSLPQPRKNNVAGSNGFTVEYGEDFKNYFVYNTEAHPIRVAARNPV